MRVKVLILVKAYPALSKLQAKQSSLRRGVCLFPDAEEVGGQEYYADAGK